MSSFVRTVQGDIEPPALGPTYTHEHLLTRPAGETVREDPDLVLDDEERSAAELQLLLEAGGRGLVEVTTPELGRDAAGLLRLAATTGFHIVAATGHICEEYWRGAVDVAAMSEAQLAGRFVRDLTEGMDGTNARAGVIKVGSSLDRITHAEHTVIRAAGAAHRETGAPITTHTTAGTVALEQLRALEAAGVDPARVCIGHLDRRLLWKEHLALARAGCFLGYDCIGKEQYHPDAERARFIARLVEEGHGRRILMAGDMARRRYLRSWGGGPGYPFILREFLPRLRAEGLGEEETRALVEANPRAFLAWPGT